MSDDDYTEYVINGPDDFPEDMPEEVRQVLRNIMDSMGEGGPQIGIVAASVGPKSDSHDFVAEQVMPSEAQLALKPGDFVTVMGSQDDPVSNSEHGILGEVLDPAEYASTFPDWEDRILNSYMLLNWRETGMETPELGWFARARLILVPTGHEKDFEEYFLDTGLEGGFPPGWLVEMYVEMVKGISKSNKNFLPPMMHCPKCDSQRVYMHTKRSKEQITFVGQITDDWENKADLATGVYAVSSFADRETTSAELHCTSCEAVIDLEGEGYDIYLKP